MTEPLSPDDALVLSYVDGTLDDGERAAFDARLRADPALRAEVEGLVALRGLLDDDERFGGTSGLDVPPPHLVDAIVRAEAAARPDAIRAAVLRAADAKAGSRPWWSQLSSWLVGGSVVGVGAAALLLVVTRADAPAVAPQNAQAMFNAPAAEAPSPPPPAAMAAAPAAAEPLGQASASAAPAAASAVAAPADDEAPAAFDKAANAGRLADAKVAAEKDALAGAPAAVVESARGGDAKADVARSMPAAAAPAKPAPAPAMEPPAESAPSTAMPRTREEFLEKKAALEERSVSKAKSAVDGAAGLRADVDRARRAQGANELLMAAEHELAVGRSASALDLAQRAEVEDRAGVLGVLPVATQVRAYAALKRDVDAARVASRLLQVAPSEPAIVDALVVGADAAVAIGDRGLARRLLQRALEPANRDAGRRATARARLERLHDDDRAGSKSETTAAPPR